MLGILALIGFALLSAARDVRARYLFKLPENAIDPVSFTFVICAVTFVAFYARACLRDRGMYTFREWRENPTARSCILWLNVFTLIAYLTTFLAIDKIDPYSNALVDYGASPAITAILGVMLLGEHLGRRAISGMLICLAGIGILTLGMTAKSSDTTNWDYGVGLVLAGVSCIASSLNNALNKTLVSREHITREKAIVLRMPAPVLGLGVYVLMGGAHLPHTIALWVNLIALAFVGVSIPLLLVVIAFERLQLKNFAFALFLIPVFTYFGSVIFLNMPVSWMSICAGLVVLCGVVIAEAPQIRPARSEALSKLPG